MDIWRWLNDVQPKRLYNNMNNDNGEYDYFLYQKQNKNLLIKYEVKI